MAVLESTTGTTGTVMAPAAPARPGPARPAGAGVRTAALAQWVVVGSLLAYGVSQTAIKAAALFG